MPSPKVPVSRIPCLAASLRSPRYNLPRCDSPLYLSVRNVRPQSAVRTPHIPPSVCSQKHESGLLTRQSCALPQEEVICTGSSEKGHEEQERQSKRRGSHRSKFTKWSILPEGILDGTSVWMDDVLLLEPYIFFWTGSADGPLEIFHVSGKKVWSLAGGPLAARIALVLSEECMSDYDDLDRVVPCVDVEMAFISASLSSVPTLPCLSYGNVLTPPRLASLYGMVTDGIESRVREMGLPSRLSRKKVLDLLYGENMAIPASGCEGGGWQLFVHVFGECTSRLVHTLAGLYRVLVSLYPIDMPEIRPLEKRDHSSLPGDRNRSQGHHSANDPSCLGKMLKTRECSG